MWPLTLQREEPNARALFVREVGEAFLCDQCDVHVGLPSELLECFERFVANLLAVLVIFTAADGALDEPRRRVLRRRHSMMNCLSLGLCLPACLDVGLQSAK